MDACELNYKSKPKIAYQLIRELALLDSMTCYWDSAMVLNARLIAANMAEQNLGNQEGIVKSAVWYLLYYEIENAWMDWEKSPTKNMIDELMRVMNLLTEEQLDSAYFEAEKLLGQKPIFKRKMIK